MKADNTQSQAPLLECLDEYAKSPAAAFHTPGHKAGRGLDPAFTKCSWPGLDLTEITGLPWEEALEKAEVLAAELHHAGRSFFLTQGASQGILAAMLGAFRPGDTVLVGRNCHISVINGLILADLHPVYVAVDFQPEWGLPLGINPEALTEAVRLHPQAKGLILTNPTYQGVAGQTRIFRQIIGNRVLLIDEAHGGHLGWSGLEGYDAWNAADIWVQGTHKLHGSLTQTGLLHLRRGRVEPERIQESLKLVTTTSPSFLLLASLDSNRRFLATEGARRFQSEQGGIIKLRARIVHLSRVDMLTTKDCGNGRELDPWKLSLSMMQAGYSGHQVERQLVSNYHIQPEYSDAVQVTFLLAPWQEPEEWQRLVDALAKISAAAPGKPQPYSFIPLPLPEQALPPRQAALAAVTTIPWQQAAGKVAAAIIAPYPPGIPLWAPGERITQPMLEHLQATLRQGGTVRGAHPGGAVTVVR